MNANDVIEVYVTEVAMKLPRKQRKDVAVELRTLLSEDLQAKAEAAGRDADEAMAIDLVNAFGLPVDVAARYRPMPTIIDPADGQRFLRAAVIGMAIICGLGLWRRLQQPIETAGDFLRVLGEWWAGTVMFSLWWPGYLIVGFGVAAWARRRWPQTAEWLPGSGDHFHGSRAALVMGLVAAPIGLLMLVEPHWVVDFLSDGQAASAAYEAFTYTDTFLRRQAPFLLVLILLYIPTTITLVITGRWLETLRRTQLGMNLVLGAVLAWTILDGPVFRGPDINLVAKVFLVIILAVALFDLGARLYQRLKPTPPKLQIQA